MAATVWALLASTQGWSMTAQANPASPATATASRAATASGTSISKGAEASAPDGDGLEATADTTAQVLSEAVVTGTRNVTDIRELPFTVDVVGREALTADYRPNILPTLMEQVPGLMLTSRGMMGYGVSTNAAGGLNLRGISGGSGQLMVLIDGIPQYNGIYGHPIADSYQTMMAERVEVLRGPASMLYGSNAMGGVINIVTPEMLEDGSRTGVNLGAGSWGTVQGEVSNRLKSGRFSSAVAAQYGRSDNHRPRMGFEQYGGHIKLGYELSSSWNTWIDGNITHFNASNPGPVSAPLYDADQWITRGAAAAGMDNDYGWTNGRVSLYSSYGWHKIDDGTTDLASNPPTRYFRSKDALTGVSMYQSARLFEGNRTTVGLDFQHIYGKAWYTDIATGATVPTANKQSGRSHRNEVAVYADFRQDIAEWLTVDAGLRLDHHSVTGTELVPQAGIVLRPIPTGTLKMMASKGFRNPTMRELYLYPPSNEDLKPERIMNYELSWRQSFSSLQYGVNLFYLNGDNLIQTAMVDGMRRNVNTGKVENSGIEAEATWRVSDALSLSTNHSLLHMAHPILAAPEYKGYIGATWRHGKWTADAGLMRVDGLYTATGTNEAKEHFTLLNATVSYSLVRGVTLWAKGDNLLAQRYEYYAGFPMPRATAMGGVSLEF